MEVQRVFLDANILFSKTLRDWFFMLRMETGGDMFTLITSEDALVEAQYSFRKRNPEVSGRAVTNIRKKTAEFCDDVIEDYPGKATGPFLDRYDLHIHSAALASGCHMLITQDKGFLDLPEEQKDELAYEILSPDDFFLLLDDSASQFVSSVTKKQSAYWVKTRSESKSRVGMNLETALRKSGCPKFAARVRSHIKGLAGAS